MTTRNRHDLSHFKIVYHLQLKKWQKLVSSLTLTVWAKFSLKLPSKLDYQPKKYERKNKNQ